MATKKYRVRHAFHRRQEDGTQKFYGRANEQEVEELTESDRKALIKRGYVEEYEVGPREPVTSPMAEPGTAGITPEESAKGSGKGSAKSK